MVRVSGEAGDLIRVVTAISEMVVKFLGTSCLLRKFLRICDRLGFALMQNPKLVTQYLSNNSMVGAGGGRIMLEAGQAGPWQAAFHWDCCNGR